MSFAQNQEAYAQRIKKETRAIFGSQEFETGQLGLANLSSEPNSHD